MPVELLLGLGDLPFYSLSVLIMEIMKFSLLKQRMFRQLWPVENSDLGRDTVVQIIAIVSQRLLNDKTVVILQGKHTYKYND